MNFSYLISGRVDKVAVSEMVELGSNKGWVKLKTKTKTLSIGIHNLRASLQP